MKIDSLSKKWEVVDIKCKVQSKRIAELENICKSKDSKQRNESNSSNQDAVQNEILSCLRNGVKAKEKYPETVRAFGFKLHSFNPHSYQFVRRTFSNNLPHISTIKSWYRNSNIDTEPGISRCSLDILEKKAREMKANGQQLVCCLMFDEMFIRKHVQWCSKTKKFLGYVTYGSQRHEIANNAIVFLVHGVNASIQVPVAHHFITTLNAEERKTILLEVLAELSQRGVIVSNITFDGLAANKSMCEFLGACFKRNNMKTFFVDQHSKRRIYIIFDPSHCIKLVRNNFYSRKTFTDSKGGKVEWRFIRSLVQYGNNNSFGLTHKLTNRHINFQNRKMHVRTAVQTLSNSSANSLEFLMGQNIRGFRSSAATIKFIKIFNNLFDVFNTQNIDHSNSNTHKSSINFFNSGEVFKFLAEAEQYIFDLQVKGLKSKKTVPIVTSLIKTGFLGFIVNIESLKGMYESLVEEQELMHMIPTYNLSQDHVEMFFSKIRLIHRTNDNPTVQQFKGSFKRIQMISDITISTHANITTCNSNVSNLLTISSSQPVSVHCQTQAIDDDDDVIETNDDPCFNGAIGFVAAEVESRLLKAGGCAYCKKVLRENEKIDIKNCVGINIPCSSSFEICKAVDAGINHFIKNSHENFKDKIMNYVMSTVNFDDLFPNFFELHHEKDHKDFLVKYIIDEFTHIKCTYVSKQKNLDMHKVYLRHKYRKEIQRAGH